MTGLTPHKHSTTPKPPAYLEDEPEVDEFDEQDDDRDDEED